MSLSQAGRQAVNPITGEQKFQQQQDFRRSQEQDVKKQSSESRRGPPQEYIPQDRVSQLFEQMQMLENKLGQELRRNAKQIGEIEREVRLKSSSDDATPILDDLQNKIYQLETKLIGQERSKSEMGAKLALQDQNMKELMYFIKNSQNKDTNDQLQIRGMLQEKITEENSNLMKEREKTKALFMELVRLGEQVEKQSESLSGLNQQYEQRMIGIESKLYNGEKALVQVAQRGDSGMNFINETNERIEKRVMSLEANLLGLGKDQLKDHDQINRVDSANQRLQEDLKSMLQMIQTDYQSRLESRMSEAMSRIVMEHEARVKQVEELRSNWQTNNQMNMERLQYEREELKEKIFSLEQFQRGDSQKKDESIKQIQAIVETQVNSIFINIQNEEAQRYAHEVALRADLLKIQENIKAENELFKSHQASITEKITDMIRIEVQNRLSSDVDLKNLTSAIATDIVSDLNQLKDQIEQQYKQIENQLQQQEREGSERAERLSLYIDEEINKAVRTSSQKYEKVKVIFQKFAEQFRQHLMNTENTKQDVESRLKMVEQNHEITRNDFQSVLEVLQDHLLQRIQDEKNYIIQTVAQTFQVIEDKMNKVDEESVNKFRVLKEAVEENHQLITDKIKLILQQNEAYQSETRNALKEIVITLSELKEYIVQFQKDQQQLIQELKNELQSLDTQIQTQKEQITTLQETIKQLNEEILKFNDNVEILQTQHDELKLKVEDQNNIIESLRKELQRIKEYQDTIQNTLDKLTENIQLLDKSIENIKSNFEAQQNELKSMEQTLSKFDEDIAEIRQRDLVEFKQAQDLIKNDIKILKDDQTNYSDSLNKAQIQIAELQQSVQHLKDNIKKLAPLPS